MGPREFFRWWRAELAGMLPDGLRRRFARRHDTLLVAVEDDGVRIARRLNGRVEELGRANVALPGARERMAAILGGMRLHATRIEVAVPTGKLLTKQIQLPMAAEENLHQVLGFEMQRQTPFRADQVYFNHRIVARRSESQQITVELSAVPRAVVDPALDLLGAGNLVAVNTEGGPEEGERRFAFLPDEVARPPSSSLRRVLLVSNVVLLAAVIAIPLLQQQRYMDELRVRLGEVRAVATTASSLQQRIDRQRARAQYLFAQKTARPASVVLLEELSRRIPDDTWLFRVEMRGGRVHLQGTSQAASALIAELEGSRFLEDVRFASPVTQDGVSGRERFHLTAAVVVPEKPALAGSPQGGDT